MREVGLATAGAAARAIVGWAAQEPAATAAAGASSDGLPELARRCSHLFEQRIVEICILLSRDESLRYNELRRRLGSISTRTLASKLALLQQEGLATRTLVDANPPRVEYRLTARGIRLVELLAPALALMASRPALPVAGPTSAATFAHHDGVAGGAPLLGFSVRDSLRQPL